MNTMKIDWTEIIYTICLYGIILGAIIGLLYLAKKDAHSPCAKTLGTMTDQERIYCNGR